MQIYNSTINPYNKTNFKGKIIDSHVHCGKWTNDLFSTNDVLEFFNRKFNNGKDTIDRVIISNLDCIINNENKTPYMDELGGNLKLLKKCLNNDKLIPFVVCQPGHGAAENIELLLNRYPDLIKGLKFHPACLDLPANDVKYIPYMKLAEKYNKPCLFHSEVITDKNNNFIRTGVSDPEYIYETARQFPNVPVILGHMGLGGDKAHEAGIATLINSIERGDAKLYADLAWVDWDNPTKPHIVEVVDKLLHSSKGDKTERLLFGTDAPLGVFGEKALKQKDSYDMNIKNIKQAIKDNFGNDANKLISRIFYRNSKKLLNQNFDKIS